MRSRWFFANVWNHKKKKLKKYQKLMNSMKMHYIHRNYPDEGRLHSTGSSLSWPRAANRGIIRGIWAYDMFFTLFDRTESDLYVNFEVHDFIRMLFIRVHKCTFHKLGHFKVPKSITTTWRTWPFYFPSKPSYLKSIGEKYELFKKTVTTGYIADLDRVNW